MKFTKIAVSSFSLGLLLSLFSCIDNDYDLGKELNLEVSVGGNLSLPIGETEQIKLDRLLEEGDVLHVIDGKYVINKADNISESVDAIDPVVIDDFAPEFTPYTVVFQKPTDTTIPDGQGRGHPILRRARIPQLQGCFVRVVVFRTLSRKAQHQQRTDHPHTFHHHSFHTDTVFENFL